MTCSTTKILFLHLIMKMLLGIHHSLRTLGQWFRNVIVCKDLLLFSLSRPQVHCVRCGSSEGEVPLQDEVPLQLLDNAANFNRCYTYVNVSCSVYISTLFIKMISFLHFKEYTEWLTEVYLKIVRKCIQWHTPCNAVQWRKGQNPEFLTILGLGLCLCL